MVIYIDFDFIKTVYMDINEKDKQNVRYSRYRVLVELNSFMDRPVAILGLIWLVLVIVDLVTGLNSFLSTIRYFIWGIFIFDFLVGMIIAPSRRLYIKKQWITAISVLLPAFGMLRFFRIFQTVRILRVAQFSRSLNLLRLTASTRRSIKSFKKILKVNSLGYVLIATIVLVFVGAAGLAYFESPETLTAAGYDFDTGITSYYEAVWWTSMIITTIGTNYWPVSPEGRFITLIIAVYALSFFGYIAANIASHFIKSSD